jgi:hypothetical protein
VAFAVTPTVHSLFLMLALSLRRGEETTDPKRWHAGRHPRTGE